MESNATVCTWLPIIIIMSVLFYFTHSFFLRILIHCLFLCFIFFFRSFRKLNAHKHLRSLFGGRDIVFAAFNLHQLETPTSMHLAVKCTFSQLVRIVYATEICLNFSSLNTKAFCTNIQKPHSTSNIRICYEFCSLPFGPHSSTALFVWVCVLSKKYILPRPTN